MATRISSLIVLVAISSSVLADDGDYDRLLAKYVAADGVRYREWKANLADMEALDRVVNQMAQTKLDAMDRNAQLAFYLNAFNACMLHETLAQYPTKSVGDAKSEFFAAKRIKVAGEQTSFNQLSADLIRKKFAAPRVDFALHFPARSSPPLQREPFDAQKLDEQLEKLTRAFISSDRGVVYYSTYNVATVSRIFDWWKPDFANDNGAIAFINQHRLPPLPADVKISFQDYDWSLDEAK